MQTEADLPPVTDLPIQECSTVTRVALEEEDPETITMTVKEEAEADHAAEQQVLSDNSVLPPLEASTGGGAVEKESQEFSLMTQQRLTESPTNVTSTPAICSPQGAKDQDRQQQQHRVDRGRSRGRRRSRWKLKFHHQALPPEYLDHYEASIAQQEANRVSGDKQNSSTNEKTASGLRIPSDKTGSSVGEKSARSPIHCLPVKIESDAHSAQFSASAPLILNTGVSPAEQLKIIPLQTLGLGRSDGEIIARLQNDFQKHAVDDEVSIINERKPVPNLNGNKCVQQGKGLLGSLLSSSQQSESGCGNKSVPPLDSIKRRSSVIMSSSSANGNSTKMAAPSTSQHHNANTTVNKVMKYQDLPYMGEITLDNMKPRRGRKPKKADICHLIYKNYGTIFPGAPNSANLAEMEEQTASRRRPQQESHATKAKPELASITQSGIKCKTIESLREGAQINHADVQNRIISSLLEKRLTAATQQDATRKNMFSNIHDSNYSGAWNRRTAPVPPVSPSPTVPCSDEPLNLCVKDLNQLKIRLLRKHGNFYEPRSSAAATNNTKPGPSPVSIKSEPTHNSSSSDLEELLEISDDSPKLTCTPDGSRNHTPVRNVGPTDPFPPTIAGLTFPSPPEFQVPGTNLPGGYVYWPGAGVFVHPMALQSQLLYYQKLGAIPLVSMSPTDQSISGQAFIPTTPLPVPHITPAPNCPLPQQVNTKTTNTQVKPEQKQAASSNNPRNLIPKAFSTMLSPPNSGKPCGVMPSELTFPRMKRLAPLGNPPPASGGTGTKRKRSAIFIPPMPSENNTNPTTEVSICKFKFTGGAKPSLQEKKMLSVDSGGNFRYYSGTGDKSMRGYEFFPRESLQQSAGASRGSPSEHFLAAASSAIIGNDKIPVVPSTPGNALRDSALVGGFQLDEHQKYLSTPGLPTDTKPTGSPSGDFTRSLSSEMDASQKSSDGRGVYFDPQGLKKKCESGEKIDGGGFGNDHGGQGTGSQHFRLQRRKRKTRKSLAREKLEQTFKEKGFLIQTQQLESAEGATYCKFRQLRKFTRYLFRSWKDYLPGNVREMSVAAGVAGPGDGSPPPPGDSELEGELSSNPPTPTSTTQSALIEDSSQQPPTS
ncbi:uncharacterized protein LOC110834404 isoform X2 [Zootermopsis nevadensis]|nr:uncharacterized protein LOC110834404 isoform X2 [Zootermopsis nevadensis]XP_021929208.1 uncharacterized protein LOC110834404 isoform X2 [Zootermopsis nevadensis]XP_021929209.1 uncharacterized protein LOC110834404 isoform X2 [Zootermopsis nevadensis]XP_021929210.1 uncharacterized protein LOC110834404 isoform X2 [Zootermopsis nevadensis]